MSEPQVTIEPDDSGDVTVRIVHGGEEGTQVRAAVLDEEGLVTNVILLPADHTDLPVEQQWTPGEGLTLRDLADEDTAVGPGHRWDGTRWQAPEPAPEPTPAGDEPGGTVPRAAFDALVALLVHHTPEAEAAAVAAGALTQAQADALK